MSSLSPGQERLWFLQQLEPDDASFNIQSAYRITGALDEAQLQRALDRIVFRHDALRSCFPDADGEPQLVVMPPSRVLIEHLDVPDAADNRDAAVLALLAPRINAPFDLASGPLFRVMLARCSPSEHVLAMVAHHIVFDGWSAHLLLRELLALLENNAVPELALSYEGFAERQRAGTAGEEDALRFWRDQLRDVPALELPVDRRAPSAASTRAELVSLHVPEHVAAALDQVARDRRCTTYMVLVAAYQAWLARHSGQEEFCVGTPTAGRDTLDTENLIGYFSNALVMRANLAGDPTFTELMARVRSTAISAYRHSRIPFERLLSDMQTERDLSRTAVFQTMFTVHTETNLLLDDELRAGGLVFTPYDAGLRRTRYVLDVNAWRKRDGYVFEFLYCADVHDRPTVESMVNRFGLLLRQIIDTPDARLSQLSMLTEPDRAQLAAWSKGSQGPSVTPVLQAIRQTGDEPAVICGPNAMTYGELAQRSDQLAGALLDAGIERGAVVAVCLPRSVAAIVSLLAVWKAGATYLPIDPDYPAERIEFILDDSKAQFVISDRALPGRLLAPNAIGVALPTCPSLDDIAYIIYTSGSTGRPKGVRVTHRSLATRVRWMRDTYELGPADGVVQFASLSFDTHAEEIYPCLTAGGTLVLLPEGATSLPELLADSPRKAVTVLDLPTAYWHELVAVAEQIRWPASLRLVILGGSQVNEEAVSDWRHRFPSVQLFNTYGPTEATIIATATELGDAGGRPPIGRPLADTSVEVRAANGVAVPPGCPGELWIGGVGVAAGYLNRPELTTARFVDGWYASGDRARWRADGQLEFLGRVDDQVKVRGYRIEPAEIESCLRNADGVEQAVVVASGESLVAYVVATDVSLTGLRAHCAASLPTHMVPNTFITLDRLPLTANGKLDVRALPPADDKPSAQHAFVAPRTDAEHLVVDVWADVLAMQRIGVFDDFFELGGHSLLATKVMARISAAIGAPVPIRTIFLHRTVAEFATAVEDVLTTAVDEMTDADAEALLISEGVSHG